MREPGTNCQITTGFDFLNAYQNDWNTGSGWNYDADGPVVDGEIAYKIRSTPLGGAVVYEKGNRSIASILAGGEQIAMHEMAYDGTIYTRWNHKDPNLKSYRSTDSNGTVLGDGTFGLDWDKIETDPDGSSVGFSDPGLSNPTESNDLFTSGWSFGTFSTGQSYVYSVDGIHVPPEFFWGRIDNGAGDLGLNLLFFSAEISRKEFLGYSVRFGNGGESFAGFDYDYAVGRIEDLSRETLVRNWLVSDAWTVNWSTINLIQLPQQKTQPPQNDDDYQKNVDDCASKISSFLSSYALDDGSGKVDVYDHVNRIVDFASGTYNIAQTAFAIANSIQETQWFSKIVEPISSLCQNYAGGCDYRGRGYTHLTGSPNYKSIGKLLEVGDFLFENPHFVAEQYYPVLTMDAFFRKAGILNILSNSNDYLSARKQVNPGENLNNVIKGAKVSKNLGDRLSRLASGVADILKTCNVFIK